MIEELAAKVRPRRGPSAVSAFISPVVSLMPWLDPLSDPDSLQPSFSPGSTTSRLGTNIFVGRRSRWPAGARGTTCCALE